VGYVEAFTKVETVFPEAKVIVHPSLIKQDGFYLLFEGSKSSSKFKDKLFFTLAIAANSFKNENGVMQKVDEFRERTIKESLFEWEETKSVALETSTLYIVACGFSYDLDFRE